MTPVVSGLLEVTGTGSGDGETCLEDVKLPYLKPAFKTGMTGGFWMYRRYALYIGGSS